MFCCDTVSVGQFNAALSLLEAVGWDRSSPTDAAVPHIQLEVHRCAALALVDLSVAYEALPGRSNSNLYGLGKAQEND